MNPGNSSLPPSSQHPHSKPASRLKPSGRKPGDQPGHDKHQRALVPPDRDDHAVVVKPDACRRRGRRLRGSDPDPLRHQGWELPEFRPIITEFQRHRRICPYCGVSACSPLPHGVPSHQSGPRLVALLMVSFRQSKRRVSPFCESVLNIPCSPRVVVKSQNLDLASLCQ
jgi:transposase